MTHQGIHMVQQDHVDWESFLTYLLVDKKLKSSPKNLKPLKSRFNILTAYFKEREFTRYAFTSFISSLRLKGYKPSYLNGFIKLAKHYDKYLGKNVIQDYSFFKEVQEDIEVLSLDEVKQIAEIEYPYTRRKEELNFRDMVVIRFLYDTACRIGELENLLWEDVKNSPVHHVLFRDTKGEQGGIEAVAITPELYNLLLKLPRYGKRVFDSNTGKIFSRNEFGNRLKERADLCGIKKTTYPHLFRHTKITHLTTIYKMPLAEISRFARHKDPKTTMRYTHPALVEMLALAYASPFDKTSPIEHFIELGRKFLESLIDPQKYKITIHVEPII